MEESSEGSPTNFLIMDANFAAQHNEMRRPELDVQVADGHGYMAARKQYHEHLKTAVQIRQACMSYFGQCPKADSVIRNSSVMNIKLFSPPHLRKALWKPLALERQHAAGMAFSSPVPAWTFSRGRGKRDT